MKLQQKRLFTYSKLYMETAMKIALGGISVKITALFISESIRKVLQKLHSDFGVKEVVAIVFSFPYLLKNFHV